jgi:hypothetical protein
MITTESNAKSSKNLATQRTVCQRIHKKREAGEKKGKKKKENRTKE